MQFGPPTPILRIFDEAKAREFYCDGAPPWGLRETAIPDPFGNRLIFSTDSPTSS